MRLSLWVARSKMIRKSMTGRLARWDYGAWDFSSDSAYVRSILCDILFSVTHHSSLTQARHHHDSMATSVEYYVCMYVESCRRGQRKFGRSGVETQRASTFVGDRCVRCRAQGSTRRNSDESVNNRRFTKCRRCADGKVTRYITN